MRKSFYVSSLGNVLLGPACRGTLLKCILGLMFIAVGGIGGCVFKDKSIRFKWIRVVDYYDQRELPNPSEDSVEVIMGRQAATERPHLLQLRI